MADLGPFHLVMRTPPPPEPRELWVRCGRCGGLVASPWLDGEAVGVADVVRRAEMHECDGPGGPALLEAVRRAPDSRWGETFEVW